MHTKQQLQQLLREAGISLRKRWGQNFLIDLNLMRLLVASAALEGNETVLEVGCGTGSMTGFIAEAAGEVVAVEIDRKLFALAGSELASHDNVSLFCTDILTNKNTIDAEVSDCLHKTKNRLNSPFYLIANLPYQVASPVIVNFLLSDIVPDGIFVTIQAEVAQRMVASPGEKAYGLLSILMQSTGTVSRLRTIKPQAFWPSPKVNSAMIAWRKDENKCRAIKDIRILKEVIDLLLGQRRKKIKNCLVEAACDVECFPLLQQAEIDPDARGETLPPEKFVQLSNLWAALA